MTTLEHRNNTLKHKEKTSFLFYFFFFSFSGLTFEDGILLLIL
uniref:Uncharacterized protein n=1 Tax=Rhizophora mucronata TaxID=61149 RepID=A0A2P2KT97_RHIMU